MSSLASLQNIDNNRLVHLERRLGPGDANFVPKSELISLVPVVENSPEAATNLNNSQNIDYKINTQSTCLDTSSTVNELKVLSPEIEEAKIIYIDTSSASNSWSSASNGHKSSVKNSEGKFGEEQQGVNTGGSKRVSDNKTSPPNKKKRQQQSEHAAPSVPSSDYDNLVEISPGNQGKIFNTKCLEFVISFPSVLI